MTPPPRQRLPEWLRKRAPASGEAAAVQRLLSELGLATVCAGAHCPNRPECFARGTATFLILGKICTRNCRYCHVIHDIPPPLDPHEPERLTEAVKALGLKYIVITSVTRDDLPDGGAAIFAGSIASLRRQIPDCRVEVLIPDFQGNWRALEQVMAAGPDVINHNIEVAPTLYPNLRPQGNYKISLELLRRIKPGTEKKTVSKSGFMVGFGEKREDILRLLEDLVAARCERLTIGQYQQPTRNHWPVMKYYHPDEFKEMKEVACAMGFRHVESGPLVRSSYHAARAVSSTLHKP
jgi:lipoic acid synthetase